MGYYFQIDGKQLQEQYKDHISCYHQWNQKEHAAEWMVFAENTGEYLSIDETALSNGELYTIVTNKAARGRKGSIVAMLKGTQAEQIIRTLERIPNRLRKRERSNPGHGGQYGKSSSSLFSLSQTGYRPFSCTKACL